MAFDIDKYRLKMEEFANNTSTRVPILLLVDTSRSMLKNGRINMINDGIRDFIKKMNNDTYASTSVELCIITFGGDVTVNMPFESIGKVEFKRLKANGGTPLGKAADAAVVAVSDRLSVYDNTGVNSYNPWIIIFSDGEADDYSYLPAAKKMCDLQTEDHWKVIAISIGDEKNSLEKFTPNHKVINLKDLEISDFFDWISKSVSEISKSRPDITDFSNEERMFNNYII